MNVDPTVPIEDASFDEEQTDPAPTPWRPNRVNATKLTTTGRGQGRNAEHTATLVRLAKLAAEGNADGFDALLHQLPVHPRLRSLALTILRDSLSVGQLPVNEERLAVAWGDTSAPLFEIARHAPMPRHSRFRAAMVTQGFSESDCAAFLQGHTAAHYIGFLAHCAKRSIGSERVLSDLSHRAAALLADPTDKSGLEEVIAEGRSAVVVPLHTYFRRGSKSVLEPFGLGLSFVGNHVNKAKRDEDFHVRVMSDDMTRQFAKLCQLMRKGQRIVQILPDGVQGADLYALNVRGVTLPIGLGAATVAHSGDAVLVFPRVMLTESGVCTKYVRGPTLGDGASRTSSRERFIEFLHAEVDTLLGSYQTSVALYARIWKSLCGLKGNDT